MGIIYVPNCSPPTGGSAIKKPKPKKKAPAKKPPAGKAKGGKDTIVFGVNVSQLSFKKFVDKVNYMTGKRPPRDNREPSNVLEYDDSDPVEVLVEVMEPGEQPPAPQEAEDAHGVNDGVNDGAAGAEEEEAPKKRGPFGLFSLFSRKKKAKPAKEADEDEEELPPEKPGKKRRKAAPPPEDEEEEDDFEDNDDLDGNDRFGGKSRARDDFDDEEEEEEEEDESPRGRKGREKDKKGKKGKGARGGRKKKGTSPVVVLFLVLLILAGLAVAAHMNGFVDLNMYFNFDEILNSLKTLPSLVGL